MPPSSGREIDLGRRLANRLLPLASVIAILISVAPPVVYYALGFASLKQTAGTYAQNLSKSLQGIILEVPALWKYSAQNASHLLSDFLHDREVASIRVTDERGQPVLVYEYATDATQRWWNSDGRRLEVHKIVVQHFDDEIAGGGGELPPFDGGGGQGWDEHGERSGESCSSPVPVHGDLLRF